MNIFKSFLKVLNKCKGPIILYTVIVVAVCAFQMSSNDMDMDFSESRARIVIYDEANNQDSQDLIDYLHDHNDVVEMDKALSEDALFYRDIHAIITIPAGYGDDKVIFAGNNTYYSSYVSMMLEKYDRIYQLYPDEREQRNELLSKSTSIEMLKPASSKNFSLATNYFNFVSYGFLAGLVYAVCMVYSSFRDQGVRKRSMISSMPYLKQQRQLFYSQCLLSIAMWIIFTVIGVIILKDLMFTKEAIYYLINMAAFALCSLSLAFFIATLVMDKNALGGIINVVALGSAFLCGGFVPQSFLPDSVLKIAHALPSYYYITNNEAIKELASMSLSNYSINILIVLGFSMLFFALGLFINARGQKIG